MITVKTNLKAVTEVISARLAKLNDPAFLRPVALAMIVPLAIRIHKDGLASSGSGIGKYSKGYLALRERKNRGSNPTVIISLTRQLENDYAAIATQRGYGIGFNNSFNFDKATWVEETYGKKIFSLTTEEQKIAVQLISDLANKAIQP